MAPDPGEALTASERDRLDAFRVATSLADLVDLTGADSEHEAYLAAKAEWRRLRGRELEGGPTPGAGLDPDPDGIPGTCVVVDGHEFWVHGVTHAGTDAEGAFLRDRVSGLVAAGATIYCEQGIRALYFSDVPEVCEMDDYRWAMRECRRLDLDASMSDLDLDAFEGLREEIDSLASRFRETAFSLIESGRGTYGDGVARALGDVASAFLTSHEDVATGNGFEAFELRRQAARDPAHLPALQRYYERAFLPQPLEREWLARHDRELEIVTHARNARMADYAVYHNEEVPEVHLIVGAAHQPGIRYYLEQLRDGNRSVEAFELVD